MSQLSMPASLISLVLNLDESKQISTQLQMELSVPVIPSSSPNPRLVQDELAQNSTLMKMVPISTQNEHDYPYPSLESFIKDPSNLIKNLQKIIEDLDARLEKFESGLVSKNVDKDVIKNIENVHENVHDNATQEQDKNEHKKDC